MTTILVLFYGVGSFYLSEGPGLILNEDRRRLGKAGGGGRGGGRVCVMWGGGSVTFPYFLHKVLQITNSYL